MHALALKKGPGLVVFAGREFAPLASAVAEHHSDEELGLAVQILSEAVLVTADDLGLGEVLRE